MDIQAYLDFSLAPLALIPRAELDQLHREFMRTVIEPMRLSRADDLIRQHRDAGDRLLIITSTNRFIVEPICQSLGIDELLATDLEMIDGRYTGKIVGTPTYREGKVERFNQWLAENNEQSEGSYFYSDSINDLPLLLQVTHPVAVDPDAPLREEAASRGWDIISLRH
jgi:HAD superfamily hydrolase (TIGR01490 family)